MNITPSSAFWPSSAAPPSTVSLSCRTTPPIRTLSSSLRALPSLPRPGPGTCFHSPHAPPATLTPQEAPRSQRAPINTQVSKSHCPSTWGMSQHDQLWWDHHNYNHSYIHMELCRLHGHVLWAFRPCPPLRSGPFGSSYSGAYLQLFWSISGATYLCSGFWFSSSGRS